jgi:molybdenum cofactor cytidylyltransferase
MTARPVAATDEVAAIVLAAGLSRRAGRNKLVDLLNGSPLVTQTLSTIQSSCADPVIVVVGHDALLVSEACARWDVITIINRKFREGLSSSLRAGLGEVPPQCCGALICLADMPFLKPSTLDALIDAFEPDKYDAAQPVHQGKPGNPVLLGRSLFAAVAELTGDEGARSLLAGLGPRLQLIEVDDPAIHRDLDTAEDLAAAGCEPP